MVQWSELPDLRTTLSIARHFTWHQAQVADMRLILLMLVLPPLEIATIDFRRWRRWGKKNRGAWWPFLGVLCGHLRPCFSRPAFSSMYFEGGKRSLKKLGYSLLRTVLCQKVVVGTLLAGTYRPWTSYYIGVLPVLIVVQCSTLSCATVNFPLAHHCTINRGLLYMAP